MIGVEDFIFWLKKKRREEVGTLVERQKTERGTEGKQVCVPRQPRGPFVLLLN